jgi:hypothetical protein
MMILTATVLTIKRISPVGESLFRKGLIFSRRALGQSFEVPSLRVWMADHDQRDSLSRRERQGRFRLEQTFFVTGFNNSHDLNPTMKGDAVAP